MYAQSFNVVSERVLETCLIVDDDVFDRTQMKHAIQRDRPDMQAFEFGTLAEARAYLKTGAADIILLDNRLPDGKGSTLATELRKDPRHAETPIIVITGEDIATLDHGIAALSKDDLNARSIGEVVVDFLKARRIARGDETAKLIEEFGLSMSEDLTPVCSRAIRTLRTARAQVARSAPFAALNALDEVENMLMAVAQVIDHPPEANNQVPLAR